MYVHCQSICVCRYMRDPVMVNLVSDKNLIPANITHEVCYITSCFHRLSLLQVNEITKYCHVVYRLYTLRDA